MLDERCRVPAWARQIVSSTIDADLLDYLRRDSYFAGLAQNYDDRIFRYFVVDQRPAGHQHDQARHGAAGRALRNRAAAAHALLPHRARLLPPHQGRGRRDDLQGGGAGARARRAGRRRAAAAQRLDNSSSGCAQMPVPAAPDARIVRLVERLEQRAPAQARLRDLGADGPGGRASPAGRTLPRIGEQPPRGRAVPGACAGLRRRPR